jgi:hypothetical protein
MTKCQLPTPEVLRKLLRYEPETGKLFWRQRTADMFSTLRDCNAWNSTWADREAFTADMRGYRMGTIFSKMHRSHRVIWAMQTGEWPQADIDHINGDRADNRWINLRSATRSENLKNAKSRSGASSPYLGVYRHTPGEKWYARITANGKRIHLGAFACETEAAHAYDAAARLYHGEFARPNFPTQTHKEKP